MIEVSVAGYIILQAAVFSFSLQSELLREVRATYSHAIARMQINNISETLRAAGADQNARAALIASWREETSSLLPGARSVCYCQGFQCKISISWKKKTGGVLSRSITL